MFFGDGDRLLPAPLIDLGMVAAAQNVRHTQPAVLDGAGVLGILQKVFQKLSCTSDSGESTPST